VDRFGRRQHFGPGSPGAAEALDALAEEHRQQEELRLLDGAEPEESGQRPECLFNFGWPKDEVPDLGAPSPQPAPRAGAQTRADDTLLRLIVALAAEQEIDIFTDKAAQQLARFLDERGDKPPAINTLKSIVQRARNVAVTHDIVTARNRTRR